MTHTQLTTDELVMIESYYHQQTKVTEIAASLKRSRQTIYTVINFLKEGHSVLEYYQQYKRNKRRCGRLKILLPMEQQAYIKGKVAQGWTLDVIIGRKEKPISCSMRTLYCQFKEKVFDEAILPMKGKINPNEHQKCRGKQVFKRNITERANGYPEFKNNLAISKVTPS